MPACFVDACFAASRAMSKPTTCIMSLALEGRGGVGRHRLRARCARRVRRPCCLRELLGHQHRRAAPQVGGQAIRRVITPGQITWSFITSSAVTSLRNTRKRIVLGMPAGLRPHLGEGRRAACRTSSCGSARRRRNSAAPAARRARRPARRPPRRNSSNALGRSVKTAPSAPGFICSKPSASTQSAAPDSIACRARNSAVEPVEQLLLTLTIGMPVMPTG